MTENLALWNVLGKTDPAQTKKFTRGGGFRGTAIKPIYTTLKMTEQFGPAGKGWGMGEPTFQVVPGTGGEVLVYCVVSLWWSSTAASTLTSPALLTHTVYGVGGDFVVKSDKNGLHSDDEAFKKAFTDAVGNAMKHIGMSADVHMGLFDDNKYVSERAEEAAQAALPQTTPEIAGGLKNTAQRNLWGRIVAATRKVTTIAEFDALWGHPSTIAAYEGFPPDWREEMDNEKRDKAAELEEKASRVVPADFDKLERPFPGDTELPRSTKIATTI